MHELAVGDVARLSLGDGARFCVVARMESFDMPGYGTVAGYVEIVFDRDGVFDGALGGTYQYRLDCDDANHNPEVEKLGRGRAVTVVVLDNERVEVDRYGGFCGRKGHPADCDCFGRVS